MNYCDMFFPIHAKVQNLRGEKGEKGDSGAEVYKNHFEFPSVGDPYKIYIATEENAVYRYDENQLFYFCVGRDYEQIDVINGGVANG